MIKYSLYKLLKKLLEKIKKLIETIGSIIAVAVFSKFKTKLPQKIFDELVVLGNGPSLNSLYAKKSNFLSKKDVIVTNDFARSDLFTIIKPNFYVIADPAFFNEDAPHIIKQRSNAIFERFNRAEWSIFLFVPFKYKKYIDKKIQNPNIKLYHFNHTPCSGFTSTTFFLFNKKLGMPYLKNILIAALMLGIHLKYKNIYLWGVDHNWMKYMTLNNDGILCLEGHHFFSNEKTEPSIWYKEGTVPWKVDEALFSMRQMFKGYHIVSHYAKKKQVTIINQTPDSMIDAFVFGNTND